MLDDVFLPRIIGEAPHFVGEEKKFAPIEMHREAAVSEMKLAAFAESQASFIRLHGHPGLD